MSAWHLEHVDAVARLTLARPPINALDQGALDELSAILVALASSRTAQCFREVRGTKDWEEGIEALLEKRPPRFAGEGATE